MTKFILGVAFVAVVLIIAYLVDSRKKKKRSAEVPAPPLPRLPDVRPDSVLSREVQADLAAGANLAFLNGYTLNVLETRSGREESTIVLARDWGVNDRAGLIGMLDWLEHAGHQVYFQSVWDIISVAAPQDVREMLESLQRAVREQGDKTDVVAYGENLLDAHQYLTQTRGFFQNGGKTDILTWDLGRAINLCRWGFDAGFLGREEALEYISRFGRRLRQHYPSWENLSECFILGFAMWSGDRQEIDQRCNEHRTLLSDAGSPWRQFAK